MFTIAGRNATCTYRQGSFTTYFLHIMVICVELQSPFEETKIERLEEHCYSGVHNEDIK